MNDNTNSTDLPLDGANPASTALADTRREPWYQRLKNWLWGYDFFISYHWASGGTYAVNLAARLREKGYDVFLDRAEYAMGDDWKKVGEVALRNTQRLIVVATCEAVFDSDPVEHEVIEFSKRGREVIPICFGFTIDPKAAAGTDCRQEVWKRIRGTKLGIPQPVKVPKGERYQSDNTRPSKVKVNRRTTDREIPGTPSRRVIADLIRSYGVTRRRTLRTRITLIALSFLAVLALAAVVSAVNATIARNEEARARERSERMLVQQLTERGALHFENGQTREAVATIAHAIQRSGKSELSEFVGAWTNHIRFVCPHEYVIEAVAFSADNTLVATSSLDGEIRLWRVSDGQLLSRCNIQQGIAAVAFCAGDRLLVGTQFGDVYIFTDQSLEKVKKTRLTRNSHVKAFSRDGQFALTKQSENYQLFSVTTGMAVREIAHPAFFNGWFSECIQNGIVQRNGRILSYQYDGDLAVAVPAGDSSTIVVKNMSTGQILSETLFNTRIRGELSGEQITGVICPDNDTVLFKHANADDCSFLWSIAQERLIAKGCEALHWLSPDCTHGIARLSVDSVAIVDINELRIGFKMFSCGPELAGSPALFLSGKHLITAARSPSSLTLERFDVQLSGQTPTSPCPIRIVRSGVRYDLVRSKPNTPDGLGGSFLLDVSTKGKLAFAEFGADSLFVIGESLHEIALTDPVECLAISPDGNLIAVGTGKHHGSPSVSLFETRANHDPPIRREVRGWPAYLAFMEGGTRIVVLTYNAEGFPYGRDGHTIQTMDASGLESEEEWRVEGEYPGSGRLIVDASSSQSIRVEADETGAIRRVYSFNLTSGQAKPFLSTAPRMSLEDVSHVHHLAIAISEGQASRHDLHTGALFGRSTHLPGRILHSSFVDDMIIGVGEVNQSYFIFSESVARPVTRTTSAALMRRFRVGWDTDNQSYLLFAAPGLLRAQE